MAKGRNLELEEFLNTMRTALSQQVLDDFHNNTNAAKEFENEKKEWFAQKFPNEPIGMFDKAVKKATNEANKQIIFECVQETYKTFLQIDHSMTTDDLKTLTENMLKRTSAEEMIKNGDTFTKTMCDTFELRPKYEYRGIFIDENNKRTSDALSSIVDDMKKNGVIIPDNWNETKQLHVTTSFSSPQNGTTYTDIGTQAMIRVVGYAYNPEIGIALDVELVNSSYGVREEFNATAEKRNPHITIANAPGVKPAESAKLFEEGNGQYYKIQPIEIVGSYGGMKDKKVDILNQYEKIFKNYADELLDKTVSNNPYNKGLIGANNKDIGDRTIYLKSIIEQRKEGPHNAGSSFKQGLTTDDILKAFVTSEYRETTDLELQRGQIKPWNRCFEIDLPGNQGIVSAKDLPNDAQVVVVDGHGNGSLEFGIAGIEKKSVDKTTIIAIADEQKECFLVVTALPGDVRSPSRLHNIGFSEGEIFTKEQVIALAGEDCVIKYLPEDRYRELLEKGMEKEVQREIGE